MILGLQRILKPESDGICVVYCSRVQCVTCTLFTCTDRGITGERIVFARLEKTNHKLNGVNFLMLDSRRALVGTPSATQGAGTQGAGTKGAGIR